MKNKKLINIFTIFISIFPLLFVYATPVPSVSVADFFLIVFILIFLLKMLRNKNYIQISRPGAIAFFIILLQAIILVLFFDKYSIILPTTRILCYIFAITVLIKNYYNINLGKKVIQIVTLIASLYLLLQLFVSSVFHYYLPGTLPFLPLTNEALAEYNQVMSMQYDYYDRVRSFFTEPSHYAIYAGLGLLIGLMEKSNNKTRKIIYSIIVTLAMILSRSSTATILIPIVFMLYLYEERKHLNKRKLMSIIILIVLLLIAFFIYSSTDEFTYFMNRIFGDSHASKDRFGNYATVFKMHDNPYLMLFGRGCGKMEIYIPSIPRIYYFYGIVGFTIFIGYAIYSIFHLKMLKKYVWIVLFILSFPSDLLLSPFILVYFPFILDLSNSIANKESTELNKIV